MIKNIFELFVPEMDMWGKWAKYYGKFLGNLPSSTGWLMTEAHIWASWARRPWSSYLNFMWIEAHIWAFCPRNDWSSYLSFMWIEAHIWAFCPRNDWSSYLSLMWIEAHIWAFCPRNGHFLLLLCFVIKFQLDRICSIGDRAIFIFWHFGLKLPIHAKFYGFYGIFSPNNVICRTSLRGNTSFEPQSVKIGPTVRPGCRIEKKGQDKTGRDRTGQERTGQDSQKIHTGVIFHLFGEKSPLNRLSQKLAQ